MAQKTNAAALEKQIRDAINKLSAEGESPTNDKVRKMIGGGSFRTIAPIVKSVKAELEAKEQAARKAPDMPEDFRDAAEVMWATAWSLADEIAASERRNHVTEIDKMKVEIDEAFENCGAVEAERDAAIFRAEDAEKKLADIEAERHEMELQVARLTARLEEREAAMDRMIKVEVAQGEASTKPSTSDAGPEIGQVDMFPDLSDAADMPEEEHRIAAE